MAGVYDVFGEVNPLVRESLEEIYKDLKHKKNKYDEFFIEGIVLELNDLYQIDSNAISKFLSYVTAFANGPVVKNPVSYKLKKSLLLRSTDILQSKKSF